MNSVALLLVLIAPLPYWALGLPWALFAGRPTLAPLLGCALAGLLAEWSMMAGLSVPTSVAIAAGVSACAAAWFWYRGNRNHIEWREWLTCYYVSALAVSLAPFPAVGVWSGDWLQNYRLGESVAAGFLPAALLMRPPLLGASTAPLWLLHGGLFPFQLAVAVASASALIATLDVIRWLQPRTPSWALWPLMLSPFFLHNNAAAWAKLLAGAFIMLSAMEAVRTERIASAVFFALAICAHEGFVIWGPLILSIHAASPGGKAALVRVVGAMAATGALLAGPLTLWVIWKHGLEAKIAQNPAVTNHQTMLADRTAPWLSFLLSIVTAFVGWDPASVLVDLARRRDALSAALIAKDVYWVLTSWISTLAGTLMGFFFPFLFARQELKASDRLSALPPLNGWMLGSIAIAFALNGGLSGLYAPWGMAQAALSPLTLGVYAILIARLNLPTLSGRQAFLRVTWWMGVLGALPWLMVNAGTSLGLWLSAAFRERFRTGSESDFIAVIENHLDPLGMVAFPSAAVLCMLLLAANVTLHSKAVAGSEVN